MGSNAGARAVSDTGSMTGVATAILALLSAGTVVSISLVGAHQLSLSSSERLRASQPSAVHAPVRVVVTPHAAAATPGSESVSRAHPSKPRTSSPAEVIVAPAVLTSPAAQHSQIHPPDVSVPSVHVAQPALTTPPVPVPPVPVPPVPTPPVPTPAGPTPPVPTPPVTNPLPGPAVTVGPGPKYPTVVTTRRQTSRSVDAYTPSRQSPAAVLGAKDGRSRGDNSACGEHAGGDHHDVYDADRTRGHDSGDHGRDGSHHDRHDH